MIKGKFWCMGFTYVQFEPPLHVDKTCKKAKCYSKKFSEFFLVFFGKAGCWTTKGTYKRGRFFPEEEWCDHGCGCPCFMDEQKDSGSPQSLGGRFGPYTVTCGAESSTSVLAWVLVKILGVLFQWIYLIGKISSYWAGWSNKVRHLKGPMGKPRDPRGGPVGCARRGGPPRN